ncbi:MAG: hypothetical protein R2827_08735 [Bdellovibrionales bacterium]
MVKKKFGFILADAVQKQAAINLPQQNRTRAPEPVVTPAPSTPINRSLPITPPPIVRVPRSELPLTVAERRSVQEESPIHESIPNDDQNGMCMGDVLYEEDKNKCGKWRLTDQSTIEDTLRDYCSQFGCNTRSSAKLMDAREQIMRA